VPFLAWRLAASAAVHHSMHGEWAGTSMTVFLCRCRYYRPDPALEQPQNRSLGRGAKPVRVCFVTTQVGERSRRDGQDNSRGIGQQCVRTSLLSLTVKALGRNSPAQENTGLRPGRPRHGRGFLMKLSLGVMGQGPGTLARSPDEDPW